MKEEYSLPRWVIVVVVVVILGALAYGLAPSSGGGTSDAPGISGQTGPCELNVTC
jgi:hypothetical protein